MVICAILFTNAIIIAVAIFKINSLIKNTKTNSTINIDTKQLALHTVVSFLFAICTIPCCLLVRSFYGSKYQRCLISVIFLCALSELGLLYIYNKISIESIYSLQVNDL